jgi:hypothetical protein
VKCGLRRRLGADRSYSGLLTKNPAHESWQVVWCRETPYSLEELARELSLRDMRPDPVAPYGRPRSKLRGLRGDSPRRLSGDFAL